MASYPSSTPSDATLYIAVDNFATTLNGAIDNVQTTITLASVVGLPTVGILTIESEKVHYTGISVNDITGVTRGFSSTTAAAHGNGVGVFFNVIEEHHNANKDEIIAIATDLRNTFLVDLDDAISPVATATNLKVRLDHIVTQLKNITGEADWKTAPDDTISNLDLTKAEDTLVVHLAGTETITGTKTLNSFSGTLAANIAAATFKLTGLGAGTTNGDSLRYEQVVGVYALDSSVVHLAGTETVTGQKNFTANSTLFGPTTSRTIIGIEHREQIEGTNSATSSESLLRNSADAGGPFVTLSKSRGAGLGSVTVVQDGDILGTYSFAGADGTGIVEGARIRARVDGTPGTNDMPSLVEVLVSPDGSDTPAVIATFRNIGVSIKGTTTNDSAAAGYVGERVSSFQTAVNFPTTAEYGDLTSISLTAGDWDVTGHGTASANSGTWTSARLGISTTAGNDGTGLTQGDTYSVGLWASSSTTPLTVPLAIPMVRMSLTATTTVYLKYRAAYTAGNPNMNGRITARRVR